MYFEKAASGIANVPQYLITIVLVAVSYIVLGQLPLMGVLLYKINANPDIGMAELDSFQTEMDFSAFGMSSNFGFFLMLLIFVISMLALMLCVRHLHQRPFVRLVTPHRTINWQKIFFGFGLWMAIALVAEVISYMMHPALYSMQFRPLSFLVLVVLCILVLPIQTSFEELFFRGYLMPWFGRLIANKWVPLILTSVLFGLVHGFNPEVEKYGFYTMQVYYISAGLFLGIITILDDSLELALGVHAATNFLGATVLSYEGSVLQTDTLFKAAEVDPIMMIITFYIGASIFMVVCWKKYNWQGLSQLWEPVGRSESSSRPSSDLEDSLIG